jgi:hypothetical protein
MVVSLIFLNFTLIFFYQLAGLFFNQLSRQSQIRTTSTRFDLKPELGRDLDKEVSRFIYYGGFNNNIK